MDYELTVDARRRFKELLKIREDIFYTPDDMVAIILEQEIISFTTDKGVYIFDVDDLTEA